MASLLYGDCESFVSTLAAGVSTLLSAFLFVVALGHSNAAICRVIIVAGCSEGTSSESEERLDGGAT